MTAGRPADLMKQALLSLLIMVIAQWVLVLSGRAPVFDGRLFDPDCYMHLQRARQMIDSGVWRLPLDGRVDAPFGGVMHWTSLFDLLLVIGAKALALLGLSVDNALFWWGSLLSPLLLLPALPVLYWGFRPLLGEGRMMPLIVLLLVLQGQAGAAFQLGRPDHQSLLMASFLIQLGCVAAMLDGRAGRRTALLSGLALGLAMWCSVEGLLFVLVTTVPLALAWALDGRPGLRLLRPYAAAALAVVGIALVYERPEGALLTSQTRLSLVHALALAGGLAALMLAWPVECRLHTRRTRLALLLGLALAALAPVATVFPDFLGGPWGKLDPALSVWHQEVEELQPLWPNSTKRLLLCLNQFAIPLATLPLLLLRLRRAGARDGWLLLPLALTTVLFWGLALAQGRWVAYVQLALLVPAAMTVHLLWHRAPRVRTAVFATVMAVQVGAGATLQSAKAARATTLACDWSEAMTLLAAEPGEGRIVLTDLYSGPEILWRTRYRVVGGPYELADAIRDTAAFMRGDDGTAIDVLRRRTIEQVLLCRGDDDADGPLATALRHHSAPPGFTPLPAPDGFVRYAVTRP
ncbi:MAG: hypothetical protein ACM31D_20715 [Bacteroidota bacterium]